MSAYRVKFNGKLVGNIRAEDMSEASRSAMMRWGPGEYDIREIRAHDEEE